MNLKLSLLTRPLVLTLLTTAALTAARAEEGWIDLFNGTNLDGWVQHGGKAGYTVEAGVLVGTSVTGTGNSFLCTAREFGDFELELEYQVDAALNSGVQIRSEVFPEARTLKVGGKDIKLPADRVHGYQVEIDMDTGRNRWWSGGIYDEARRGWLFPTGGDKGAAGAAFTQEGAKASRPGAWNKLRVVAVGPSIKTWLNDVPRADITDSLTPLGFIALQVHGVGNDPAKSGMKVCFRNVRVKPLAAGPAPNTLTEQEKRDGWRLLWDGKTTEGWRGARAETFPARGWVLQDGVLTVHENSGAESAGGGDIITRERFSHFELLVDFKITPGANSGIKYFVQPNLDPITGTGAKAATGSAIGLEFQILDDARHPDAKLGRDGNRTFASLYDLIPASTAKQAALLGEWNTARIVAQGRHVEHWLNGRKVLEYERDSAAFRSAVAQSKYKNIPNFGEWPDGHILLQEHGSEVSFRNVKLRELPAK
jgi:hypothetical protein